jgi:predicted ABC-type ATPase
MTTTEKFLHDVNFDEPTVFIFRGLPGSGKTTLAEKVWAKYLNISGRLDPYMVLFGGYKTAVVCSADNYYHLNSSDGSYQFDKNKTSEAHNYCLRTFIGRISSGRNEPILVANTNTAIREFAHYVKIAKAYGFRVVVVSLDIDTDTSYNRNIHSVPLETIELMQDRYLDAKIDAYAKTEKITHRFLNAR